MHHRRRHEMNEEDTGRWIVPYADFVTLLFVFFTALFAISQVDMRKLGQFSGSMRTAFSQAPREKTWTVIEGIKPLSAEAIDLRKEFMGVVSVLKDKVDISMRTEARGVVVSLGERTLFQSGRATLSAEAAPALAALSEVLRRLPNKVTIEGHTDSVPLSGGAYASNWELSTARATSVLRHMVEVLSVRPAQLSAAGYAEFRPVAPNETPEGRAKNRRVDIVILDTSAGGR